MIDNLASLYPPFADHIQAVLQFPIPRLPDAPEGRRNLESARSFYGDRMLHEVSVDMQDRVAFIDKAFPHSRFDLMLLASDDEIRSAFTDLSTVTKAMLLDTSARFVDYVSDPKVMEEYRLGGGHLHLCFNYNRDTDDRENSMYYDKRFHLHLNYWPGFDLMQLSPTRWGDISSRALKRRLLDPISFLAVSVMHEVLGGVAGSLELMPVDPCRDVAAGLPVGLKIRLQGWKALRDPRLIEALDALHLGAVRAYDALYAALTGESYRPQSWSRPALLPTGEMAERLAAIPWLSTDTRQAVLRLGTLLRGIRPNHWSTFKTHAEARVRCMAIGSLDYAISLFSWHENTTDHPLNDADEVFLVMQFKLFGDIGGAGLPPLRGVPIVLLDRGAGGVMTAAEYAERRRFRATFIDQTLPLIETTFRARVMA